MTGEPMTPANAVAQIESNRKRLRPVDKLFCRTGDQRLVAAVYALDDGWLWLWLPAHNAHHEARRAAAAFRGDPGLGEPVDSSVG